MKVSLIFASLLSGVDRSVWPCQFIYHNPYYYICNKRTENGGEIVRRIGYQELGLRQYNNLWGVNFNGLLHLAVGKDCDLSLHTYRVSTAFKLPTMSPRDNTDNSFLPAVIGETGDGCNTFQSRSNIFISR